MDNEIKGELKSFLKKEPNLPKTKCLDCSNDLVSFQGCQKCDRNICLRCCREFGSHKAMLCKVCYGEMLIEAKSVKWFCTNDSKKKSSQAKDPNEIVVECVPKEERSVPLDNNKQSYKLLVANIADKVTAIDVETINLTKDKFGPKKTYGKTTELNQKDKIPAPPSNEQKASVKSNDLAMENLIAKLVELNNQYKTK